VLGNVKEIVLQVEPFKCWLGYFVPAQTGIKSRQKGNLERQITAGGSYRGFGEMRFNCVSLTETLSDPIKRPAGLRQRLGRAELHRPGRHVGGR
jgi:hypothetical protein